MKRLTLNLIYVIVCLVVLTGCRESRRQYVIGVSQCSDDIWRDKLNSELQTGTYFHEGVELRLASADDDDRQQVEQIEGFIHDGIDLLIVAPNQVATITPAIDHAYDLGIPVIVFDRRTSSEKYTAYIGADNREMGRMMGDYIAAQLDADMAPEGGYRVVEVMGLEGSSPAIERHEGFSEVLARHPHIRLVASLQGDWTGPSAREAIEGWLDGQTTAAGAPHFVFAQNDRMALGARQALEAAGIHDVRYLGIDGLPGAGGGIVSVRDSLIEVSCIYPTHGDEVLRLALDILERRPYNRENMLQTALVTRENANVLLMQHDELRRQSQNLEVLHDKVTETLGILRTRTSSLILLFILLIVLAIASFVAWRAYQAKAELSDRLRRMAQKQRALTEEISEMNRAQTAFYTGISHELRTPLTLIADPVDHLRHDPQTPASQRPLLDMVARSVESLRLLVSELLDMRKVQAGKMPLRPERFDLAEALGTWTEAFSSACSNKGIAFTLDLSALPQGRAPIVADRDKVATIVRNLLSNAMKFTLRGGSIGVSLSASGDCAHGGNYTLTVADTGRGIPAADLPHLFERFYQAEGTTGGSGLGLYLVEVFARLHGGSATVESEVGQGSTFHVTLAQRSGTAEEGAKCEVGGYSAQDAQQPQDTLVLPPPSRDAHQAPQILVVDDNDDVRQYLTLLLAPDYDVIAAADGAEGLAMTVEHVPDLVVGDVMMPVMGGLEMCRRLKQDTATCHIPVLLLTARAEDAQRAEGYDTGADAYLTKPFNSQVLFARIRNLLAQRALLQDYYSGLATSIATNSQNSKPSQNSKDTQDSQPSHQASSATADNVLKSVPPSARDRQFIERFHTYIENHLGEAELSVEQIAAALALSRVQMYRKVKALTGTSPVDLLRRARLQRARTLLRDGSGRNVSEVAYEVGFTTPAYFSKCFKDEFGINPTDVQAG